jgi:ribosome maturation factor RimP
LSDSRTQQIEKLASSILDRWEMFLVGVEIQGGSETVIWVYVDSEDRDVGLDECAEVSQELGFLLDAHEVVSSKYRLNVSTPGVDRPLVDPRQYKKNKGRKARVKFRNNGEKQQIEGRINDIQQQSIKMKVSDGTLQTIEFSSIIETVIVPEINK